MSLKCKGYFKNGNKCRYNANTPDGYCKKHQCLASKEISEEAHAFLAKHKRQYDHHHRPDYSSEFYNLILMPMADWLYNQFNFNEFDKESLKNYRNTIAFSAEPQYGKTIAALIIMWVERFIYGLNPVFITDKLNENLKQFDKRLEDFNEKLLPAALDYAIKRAPQFENDRKAISEIVKIRPIDPGQYIKDNLRGRATPNLSSRLCCYVPRIIANSTRMDQLILLVTRIKETTNSYVALIVDETHSMITDPRVDQTPIIRKFNKLLDLATVTVGITATPHAIFFHDEINHKFNAVKEVRPDVPFYIERNLIALCFLNETGERRKAHQHQPIIQFPISFAKWSDDQKQAFIQMLNNYRDVPWPFQKQLAITGPALNDEQKDLAEYIHQNFPEALASPDSKKSPGQFQIFVMNQDSDEILADFLNRTSDDKPIVVIGRHSMDQGLTFKPTDERKLKILPVLSHQMIVHGDSPHDEGVIQKVRCNSICAADVPAAVLIMSNRDYNRTRDAFLRNQQIMEMCRTTPFNKALSVKDKLRTTAFKGTNGDKLTRPNVNPKFADCTELVEFQTQEAAVNFMTINNLTYEVMKYTKKTIKYTPDPLRVCPKDKSVPLDELYPAKTKLSDLSNERKLRETASQAFFADSKTVERVQVAYHEPREKELLKAKVNPYANYEVQILVGSPEQSVDAIICIHYPQYEQGHFTDNKYYIFPAPNGNWYASQHNPRRDRMMLARGTSTEVPAATVAEVPMATLTEVPVTISDVIPVVTLTKVPVTVIPVAQPFQLPKKIV